MVKQRSLNFKVPHNTRESKHRQLKRGAEEKILPPNKTSRETREGIKEHDLYHKKAA